ncbi:MAG: MarR family transcriptional regulator [Sphingobacteriales bacterium]|jgi:DNA-binding MarR family transcriptional regulator|nr:MarR family transcriptional regulator [Sphingobacteriales bacterium]
MILEKAIQQSKFKSAHHKVILNLVYTAGLVQAEQARFFKQYDLSPQQYNVLRILRGQHPNPVCVGLVQERMLDQMSNASRLIEKLKLKNLLTRKECKEDRRQVDVVITKDGLDLLSEIDKEFNKFEAYINCLDSQEANQLNALLDKLANQF